MSQYKREGGKRERRDGGRGREKHMYRQFMTEGVIGEGHYVELGWRRGTSVTMVLLAACQGRLAEADC